MDLKKVNKDNLDIMFYKHIKDVVKEYDNYVYQKEQLMFLDVMHELAVEHTLDVLSVIEKSGIDKVTLNDTIDNGVEKSLKANDSYIVVYENHINYVEIQLGGHVSNSSEITLFGVNFRIFKSDNRYRLYANVNDRALIDAYGLNITYPQEIKEIDVFEVDVFDSNCSDNNLPILFIGNLRPLWSKNVSEVFNLNNIEKESAEIEYLKFILLDNINSKKRLKAFLKEYAKFTDNADSNLLKDCNTENICISKADVCSNSILYNLMFDVNNIMPMLYDYMLKNIEDYICYSEDKGIICSKDVMLSYDVIKHFDILFGLIKLDLNMLAEYKKTRDIKPIVTKLFENILKSNYTTLDISNVLQKITSITELNFIMKGNKIEGNEKPNEIIKLNVNPLKMTLTSLVDGRDGIHNFINVIALLNNSELNDITSLTITSQTDSEKTYEIIKHMSICPNQFDEKIKGRKLSYNGNTWGKDTLDKLCNLL